MNRFWSVIIVIGILFFVTSSVRAEQFTELELKGVEIAKGIDRGDTRYGATFIGRVIDEGIEIGYFYCVLNFMDYQNIEVCGGTNDIVWLRISVIIADGDYQGHRLVLGMRDYSGIPDVFWDYDPLPCPIGGLGCKCPNWEDGNEANWLCSVNDASTARIGSYDDQGIELKRKWGSSRAFIRVKKAYLNGFLCHNYPFVPRVSGTLQIEWSNR